MGEYTDKMSEEFAADMAENHPDAIITDMTTDENHETTATYTDFPSTDF